MPTRRPVRAHANAGWFICVPPGAMGDAAREAVPSLPKDALVSDVGSCKQSIAAALSEALPGYTVIPAHPVAGTEHSGPDAGFASLFRNRWCIVTPPQATDLLKLTALVEFWEALGANVEMMDAASPPPIRPCGATSSLPTRTRC
jgi:cyclohexadieny/prephenate dehydrogenase